MKYLIMFAIFCISCQPSENLEESICLDRCLRIEGTITNGLTGEPYKDLSLKLEYRGFIFSNFGSFNKARVKTDANGYYSINVEAFDAETSGNGRYELTVENDDKVFWKIQSIYVFRENSSQININDTYVEDFMLHRPAYIKYDMDGLAKLKEDEKIVFRLEYEIETIFGKRNTSNTVQFRYNEKRDKGEIKVAAEVPIRLIVIYKDANENATILREESSIVLEYDEEYEVEIGI